jgi:nucleoside-diphosphate-sugar epimerase
VVYDFCRSAYSNKFIEVNSEVAIPFDVIHVNDVVQALIHALSLERPRWNCFNISTGESCSLELLAGSICKLVPGCNYKLTGVPQPVVTMSPLHANNALSWKAMPRQDRLKQMIESIKNEINKGGKVSAVSET